MAKVTHKSGSEGPTHDPYTYDEWTVEKNGRVETIHFGLIIWLEVDHFRVYPRPGEHYNKDEKELLECFERFCGCSLHSISNGYHRYRNTCRSCGCRSTHEESGFPGESLNLCDRCGAIVSIDMDWSAIE